MPTSFKVGDVVRCVDAAGCVYIRKGDVGTISEVVENIFSDQGPRLRGSWPGSYYAYRFELVTDSETKAKAAVAAVPEVPKVPARKPCVVESIPYAAHTGNKKDVLLQVYQKGRGKHHSGSLNIMLTHGLFQCCGFGGIEGFSGSWNPHMMDMDEFASLVHALHNQKTVAADAGWSYGEPGRRNYMLTNQQVQYNTFHKFLVMVCGAKVVQEFKNHYDSGHHLTMFTVDTFEAMSVFWQCTEKQYYGKSLFKKLPVAEMDADGKLKAFLASVPVPKQYD